MADYTNNNRTFNNGLYGTRANQDVNTETALENAFGSPPPLTAAAELTDGRGGFFNLSASNNSMELVSGSNVGIFANDPVVGLLFNLVPAATGSHIRMHHLVDPQTGGGAAGNNNHAAATIRFAGNYVNTGVCDYNTINKIALVTKNGNTITYTMDKHETVNHRHSFSVTGSAGSDFDHGGGPKTIGLNGTDGAVGPNMRRLVALGYR